MPAFTREDRENLERNRIVGMRDCDAYTPEGLTREIGDPDAFLATALSTRAEWRGLYGDGLIRRVAGLEVLNIGSGVGLDVLVMAAFGARVTAVDIADNSAALIDGAARLRGWQAHVTTHVQDICRASFSPKSFDLIVGNRLLHHLTPNQERACIENACQWLRAGGEARFYENAENNAFIERLRWIVPMPGRPSVLHKKRFAAYRAKNPSHPQRSNSSLHYRRVFSEFFGDVEVVPNGGLERFHRLFRGRLEARVQRAALYCEEFLPLWLHLPIARRQTIRARRPRHLQ